MIKIAKLISGSKISADIKNEVKQEVEEMVRVKGVKPGLGVVLVGENPASKIYVKSKQKGCDDVGFKSESIKMDDSVSTADILAEVNKLNSREDIHGILVQLPLPQQVDKNQILEAILPEKDVDGFHPYNVGRLVTGNPLFQPCTPYGVMKMLERTGVDLKGKEVVVVGRSNIVGKPVALMCLAEHATVTICHSRTRDLPAKVAAADVVIAAVGIPEMIKGDWIKEGAVVIDVGVNRVGGKKLVGDVDFAAASEHASAITPVPGGVGPMTITMLLYNTVVSAKRRAAQK